MQAAFKGPEISIHALLAESDFITRQATPSTSYFYPRSPCGERPLAIGLSTKSISNFYPRSPCGERPLKCRRHLRGRRFLSTLSLRRATWYNYSILHSIIFLSTLSLRRATEVPEDQYTALSISIHALLAESDPLTVMLMVPTW